MLFSYLNHTTLLFCFPYVCHHRAARRLFYKAWHRHTAAANGSRQISTNWHWASHTNSRWVLRIEIAALWWRWPDFVDRLRRGPIECFPNTQTQKWATVACTPRDKSNDQTTRRSQNLTSLSNNFAINSKIFRKKKKKKKKNRI